MSPPPEQQQREARVEAASCGEKVCGLPESRLSLRIRLPPASDGPRWTRRNWLNKCFTLAFGGGRALAWPQSCWEVLWGLLTLLCPFHSVLVTAATWGPWAGVTAVQGGDLLNPHQLINPAAPEPRDSTVHGGFCQFLLLALIPSSPPPQAYHYA